ncbi:hypothetical protein SprV_0401518900 [Sparganum proliferum]
MVIRRSPTPRGMQDGSHATLYEEDCSVSSLYLGTSALGVFRTHLNLSHFGEAGLTKSAMSTSQPVSSQVTRAAGDGEAILRVFSANALLQSPYTITLPVDHHPVKFEIDTGSVVTLINEASLQKLPSLLLASSTFRSYTGQNVEVRGVFTAEVEHDGELHYLPVHVVRGSQQPNLLGRNWIKCVPSVLSYVHRIGANPDLDSILVNHKDLFRDDSATHYRGPPVKFQFQSDFRPWFFKARTVPYAVAPKVEEELDRLQKVDIIEPVQYSEWAAPIVPVLKSDGSVRTCGDYKLTINSASKLNPYPLPRIEDLYASLAGGHQFTTLDLKHAYDQVVLDTESRDATTINTHRGLFRYKRLPFGEQLTFPKSLEQMELEIKKSQAEVATLQNMYADAVLAKDAAMQEMRYQEDVTKAERKRRETELSSMRRVVEGKKSVVDKNDKRVVSAASGEGASGENADSLSLLGPTEDQLARIKSFEDMFAIIKDATGVSDVEKMVKRMESLVPLNQPLLYYLGCSNQKLLNEYVSQAEQESVGLTQVENELTEATYLLVRCKSGIQQIVQKLKSIRVDASETPEEGEGGTPPGETEATTSDPTSALLKLCSAKVQKLIAELSDVDVEEQLKQLNNAEFFEKTEEKLPEHNMRITLPQDQEDTGYEEDDEMGMDEGAAPSRTALKKQSQQIVDLRTKKKQGGKKGKKGK